jgi:hypothetical protein
LTEAIYSYLDSYKKINPDLTDEELTFIEERVTVSELKNKTFYLKSGDIQNDMSFLFQGLCTKKEIKKFKKTVLIIHSKEDKLVPFYMGEKIYKNANEPKEFYEVDKRHLEALQYYSKEISEKIKRTCKIE